MADSSLIFVDDQVTLIAAVPVPRPIPTVDFTQVGNATVEISTVSALKNLNTSSLADGTTRRPKSYRTGDTVAMPWYRLQPKGTYVPNDGTILQSSFDANKVWVADIVNGVINAAWFGTYGDGVTNDLGRLQLAWNFAVDNGYNVLYVPKGNYHLTSRWTLSSGFQDSTNRTLIGDNAVFDNTVHVGESEGLSLKNITVDGATGNGFEFSRGQHVVHERLIARNCGGDGFYFGAAGGVTNSQFTRSTIIGCLIDNCQRGVQIDGTNATVNRSWFNNNIIIQLTITNCSGICWNYEPGDGPGLNGGETRSRHNYNAFLGTQFEVNNGNISFNIPEGSGNGFFGCHAAAENGSGVSAVIDEQYNTIVGGRWTGRTVLNLTQAGFFAMNEQDEGFRGYARGFQLVDSEIVRVTDKLFNGPGWSFIETSNTVAGDGQNNHSVDVNLVNLGNTRAVTLRITGSGQQGKTGAAAANSFTFMCQVRVIKDDLGNLNIGASPIFQGANCTLDSVLTAGSGQLVRVRFDTTFTVGVIDGTAEYSVDDGSEILF